MIPIVSRENPLTHYVWGNNCDGWNLVDKPELSVKMERMPPHTAEQEHFHGRARQFFFILKGSATFVVVEEVGMVEGAETNKGAETRIEVRAQQGLEIPAGLRHRILNESEGDLEFILCSQPSTAGDRINIINESK
jgi:mannose-6-phosphate isomerase-like protein (cupin superfamily)